MMHLFARNASLSTDPDRRSRLLAVVALVLLAPPAVARAQAVPSDSGAMQSPAAAAASPDTAAAPADNTATGRSHTVRKGDTLWDLGRTYLNDPFQWPQIYRLNTAIVENPHWIYPGEVLKLPGDVQLATNTHVVDQEATAPGGPTVFSAALSARGVYAPRFGPSALEYQHSAVRPGEIYAAPWVDRIGGPEQQGRLLAPTDPPGIAEFSTTRRLGPETRAYITLPKGIVAAPGDRFVTVAMGPTLTDTSQVVIPTGIVQVEKTDNGGVATTVRIVQQFGEVLLDQGVVPLDRFALDMAARPQNLSLGLESHVIYVPDGAVLPTVQHYVVLDATSKDGVKAGDQFTLYRPSRKLDVPGQSEPVVLPEEEIALAQVVKVTERGTTALIVSQRQPRIRVGVMARLTGRMP
jgi:hypothetical protein